MINIHDELHRHMDDDIRIAHDNEILAWLKPYGVTRENCMRFIPRIVIEECDGSGVQHWFLDGAYIFSVETIQEWTSPTSMTLSYRKFVREKTNEQ